jgi:(p)ppGpp synthase/HD superfamily hydrolase
MFGGIGMKVLKNPEGTFEKLMIAARYWLRGLAENDERYYLPIKALEKAAEHHNGRRNGGDPAFIHQLGIFHHIRTLHKHLIDPVMVYTLIFLHDYIEDPTKDAAGNKHYKTTAEVEEDFGPVVLAKVLKLSKEIMGQPNPDYDPKAIWEDPDCSIAKGGDRVNNVSTMVGVFKLPRLERYVVETIEVFLPGLKSSRRKFPQQEAVYENIKLELINQLQLIEHIVNNLQAQAAEENAAAGAGCQSTR